MYNQLCMEIDRQLKVGWEIFGVLIGAFAILTLVEKQVVDLDTACSVIIGLVGWVIANTIESNYWYNRNLAIIANIERQFLKEDDLKNIHPYFGKHRKKSGFLTILKLQVFFVCIIGFILTVYHFAERIAPGFKISFKDANIEVYRIMPYLILLMVIIYLLNLFKRRQENYENFVIESPGIPINSSGISYDSGHPVA